MNENNAEDHASSVDHSADGGPEPGDALSDALSAAQHRALAALLHENTIARAAEAAEVGERTLHRWLREDPSFVAAYRAARREAFGQAVGLTQRFASTAIGTLVRVMTDGSAPHTARVSAAVALLRFAREGIELDDIAARLDALEERLA